MDRKDLNTLERLFQDLADNSKIATNKLPVKQLQFYISTLETMGLNVAVTANYIQVKHKIAYINKAKLITKLQAWKINKPVKYVFTTNSTNQLAKLDKKPAIYLSAHQSHGQGRQTKRWQSPLGQSISISINHDFGFGLSELSGLNIAIAVAIVNTAKKFAKHDLGLKWPNDIVSQMGKVGGILIEASGNSKTCRATIGIGLNWQLRQSMLDTIDQKSANIEITKSSLTEFVAQLVFEIDAIVAKFSESQLQQILPIWQQHDVYINKMVKIIQGDKTWQAKYVGVNLQGELQVDIAGEIQLFTNGEVSLR